MDTSILKSKIKIKVIGLILSNAYQRAKLISEKLHYYVGKKFWKPQIRGLLEVEWEEYIRNLRKELGGQTWALQRPVAVFINKHFLGSDEELYSLISHGYRIALPSSTFLTKLAYQEYSEYINRFPKRSYVYFQVSIDNKDAGGFLFQLYSDLLPNTCEHFRNLCTNEFNSKYSYIGSKIERICKAGWLQGGAIADWPSEKKLPDESYAIMHDRRGVLSLANDGKDSNGTQFFITFNPARWMDYRYVAFGQVVEGSELLRTIENISCTYESPNQDIVITNCNILPAGKELHILQLKKRFGILESVKQPIESMYVELETDNVTQEEKEVISFLQSITEKEDVITEKTEEQKWMSEILLNSVFTTVSIRQIVDALLKAVFDYLALARPPDDVLDIRDVSSRHLLLSRYLAGLYELEMPSEFVIFDMIIEWISKILSKTSLMEIGMTSVTTKETPVGLASVHDWGSTGSRVTQDSHTFHVAIEEIISYIMSLFYDTLDADIHSVTEIKSTTSFLATTLSSVLSHCDEQVVSHSDIKDTEESSHKIVNDIIYQLIESLRMS